MNARSVLAAGFALVASAAMAEPPPMPMTFQKSTEIYTATNQVRMYSDNPIYFGANMAATWGTPAAGVWHRVDLKKYGVAADAKAAFLSGMLIITHGTTVETADMTLTARSPGDNASDCNKYLGQAIEASVGNGIRSNASFWVPLVNGEFDWCWKPSTGGVWPTNSAYGGNFSLLAWVR